MAITLNIKNTFTAGTWERMVLDAIDNVVGGDDGATSVEEVDAFVESGRKLPFSVTVDQLTTLRKEVKDAIAALPPPTSVEAEAAAWISKQVGAARFLKGVVIKKEAFDNAFVTRQVGDKNGYATLAEVYPPMLDAYNAYRASKHSHDGPGFAVLKIKDRYVPYLLNTDMLTGNSQYSYSMDWFVVAPGTPIVGAWDGLGKSMTLK